VRAHTAEFVIQTVQASVNRRTTSMQNSGVAIQKLHRIVGRNEAYGCRLFGFRRNAMIFSRPWSRLVPESFRCLQLPATDFDCHPPPLDPDRARFQQIHTRRRQSLLVQLRALGKYARRHHRVKSVLKFPAQSGASNSDDTTLVLACDRLSGASTGSIWR
jgi:hypothetical protein